MKLISFDIQSTRLIRLISLILIVLFIALSFVYDDIILAIIAITTLILSVALTVLIFYVTRKDIRFFPDGITIIHGETVKTFDWENVSIIYNGNDMFIVFKSGTIELSAHEEGTVSRLLIPCKDKITFEKVLGIAKK